MKKLSPRLLKNLKKNRSTFKKVIKAEKSAIPRQRGQPKIIEPQILSNTTADFSHIENLQKKTWKNPRTLTVLGSQIWTFKIAQLQLLLIWILSNRLKFFLFHASACAHALDSDLRNFYCHKSHFGSNTFSFFFCSNDELLIYDRLSRDHSPRMM